MSTTFVEETSPRPRLARFTVDQYEAMIERGILREGAPIELTDGLLVHKNRAARGQDPMTVGTGHAITIDNIGLLSSKFRKLGCTLRIQNPIRLPPDDEPEPDASVIAGKPDPDGHHPGPGRIHSVIEVSDSSLEYDRTTKARIYASAGIPQYLIVNLVDEQIEVHDRPRGHRYSHRQILGGKDVVKISAGSKSVSVRVSDLLP